MKYRIIALLALVPMLIFSCVENAPEDPEKEPEEQVDPQPDPPTPATPADDLAPEVKDGDTILVTHANMEKFVTQVSYPENDYSFTHILDDEYAPTAPGNADKPQSYTIRWTADETLGAPTVRLWEDDGWSREYTGLDAKDYYLTITNMRPNADYHFKVTAGETTLKEGSFRTIGHVHQVFFYKQVRNARDLGGWKTKDGKKMVKYRKIYRGGRLEKGTLLIPKGKADLLAEGIRAELDLRGKSDVQSEPPIPELEFCAPVIEEGYRTLLEKDQEKLLACWNFIYKCVTEDKPVYFHCSLGRDRTGTIAMLILGILGVHEGEISKEYELTQFAPHGWATSDKEKTKMTRKKGVDYDSAAGYIWSFGEEGSEFADCMKAYLVSLGVPEADIENFRTLMLEDIVEEN